MPTCRICGTLCSPDELLDGLLESGGCVSCTGTPRCDQCGHIRSEHAGRYGGTSTRCKASTFDVPTLSVTACTCDAFVAAH